MDDYNRSKSYGGSGTMQMESYYGPSSRAPPPTNYELRSYSVSYAQSQMSNYNYNNNNRELKKGKSTSKSSSWALTDPELQRKKRVASYKMYSVEGKMKGTFRKSFRWLKMKMHLFPCGDTKKFEIVYSIPKSNCLPALSEQGFSAITGKANTMEELEPYCLRTRIRQDQKLSAEVAKEERQLRQAISEKRDVKWNMNHLNWQNKELKLSVVLERRKMDLLQELLNKLRFADNAYQKKPIEACLSAQEINNHKLNSRMVHGSKNLAKEKQLIKKKQLEENEDTSFASFWTRFEED